MGTILWTYKVNPLQPRNLISLVFMSQSSSGIDYEEFRPLEVGLTPLVANGSNLGVQLELKSLFPKEIRPVSMVLIFTFSPNLWSLSGVYHWIPHFKSFPTVCGTPKSDIRIKSYGHSKLACRAQWADPPERAQSGWPNHGQFLSMKMPNFSHSSPLSINNHP